jgi:hypothetical protein
LQTIKTNTKNTQHVLFFKSSHLIEEKRQIKRDQRKSLKCPKMDHIRELQGGMLRTA